MSHQWAHNELLNQKYLIEICQDSRMEQQKRLTIVELVRAGRSAKEIIEATNYPKMTIYCALKVFQESGRVKRAEHSSRWDQIQKATYVANLKKSIQRNHHPGPKPLG